MLFNKHTHTHTHLTHMLPSKYTHTSVIKVANIFIQTYIHINKFTHKQRITKIFSFVLSFPNQQQNQQYINLGVRLVTKCRTVNVPTTMSVCNYRARMVAVVAITIHQRNMSAAVRWASPA